MSQVAIITKEQSELIFGKEFHIGCHFNPIQDCNSRWVISEEEIQQTTNPDYMWVKELQLIEFCPPVVNIDELLK